MLPLDWKTVPLSTAETHAGAVMDIDGVYVIFDEISVFFVGQSDEIQRDVLACSRSEEFNGVRNGKTVYCSFAPVHTLLKDSVERYLYDTLKPVCDHTQPKALPREVRLPYELSYAMRHRLDALIAADSMPSYGFAP